MFGKFYNVYKRPDCKPILINTSFIFKKQNFLVLFISTEGIQIDPQKIGTIFD